MVKLKKLIIFLLIALILIFVIACNNSLADQQINKTINYDQISNIEISLTGLIADAFEFKFDKSTLKSSLILGSNNYYPKNEKWTEEKYDNFINDLKECQLEKWNGNYIINSGMTDGYQWEILLTNGSETILSLKGINKMPDDWEKINEVLAKYVDSRI
jgi:hypothetical protein